jgi:hypothetical protein
MTEISDAEIGKATVIVNDARGRQLEVRKLKPLDRLRLVEMIGADNALNQPYLGYATLAASVVAIDGKPVRHLSSKLALEAVVQQLDDDGLNAVGEAFKKLYGDAVSADESQAQLKNE